MLVMSSVNAFGFKASKRFKMKYQCLVVDQDQKKCDLQTKEFLVTSLASGEVAIKSTYSGINYKDALGVTLSAPIFKKSILIPGIDVAGQVLHSKSKKFKAGDWVLINGMGLGETMDGGFSEIVTTPDDMIVPLPKGLSDIEAMTLGTSGFTAALAIERMLANGQTFEHGPILVSGATGGVGQAAIQILNQLGFLVEAVTSRSEFISKLECLGAHHVSLLEEHLKPTRPLEGVIWGGAIDNLGGDFLSSIIPKIQLWGNVASIGLALGPELKTSVMPFILRGVSLLGASSNNCSMVLREKIWQSLATTWKPKYLDQTLTQVIGLDQVVSVSKTLIDHTHFGKTVIRY